ncbi:MAG TPA: sigma factor [Acidimicrobiales bacterium]|nr:sigma factor [Acidimicrobiales bacterium]
MASLCGVLGDVDLAEEAAQEAFAIAAERWPRDWTPQHPVAWLVAAGRNRAIDRLRRERTLDAERRLLQHDRLTGTVDEIDLDDSTIEDERLKLIFTCCHPARAVEAQVALTLRALGGLTTEEITRAFIVSEETMKAPAHPGKGEDQGDGHPVRGAGRPDAAGPLVRGARRDLPDLHRGLHRPR